MISLCKYNGNASVRSRLEKEDRGHGSQTKSTVDGAKAGGGTGLGAAVRLAGGVVAICAGVDELAGAVVLALDQFLILESLVEVASLGDVISRLQVEGTLDAVKLGGLNSAHVTGNVESSTNASQLREAVNAGEVGVVGDLEVVRDLGEEREADVGELLIGDNGKSLANGCQVGGGEAVKAVVVKTERSVQGLEGGHLKGTDETERQVGGPDEVGERDSELLVVVGEGERVRDVAELHVDLVDVAVVSNEDGLGLLDVDALKGAKGSVLDVDLVG